METNKLKRNKKVTLIIILVFICCITFAIWGISLPDVDLWTKGILTGFVLLLLYQSLTMLVGIDEPIIVLTKTTIQIKNENKDSIYLWSDILDFKVDYKIRDDKVHEYSLTILTNRESRTFNIIGITKRGDELKQLIDNFRG